MSAQFTTQPAILLVALATTASLGLAPMAGATDKDAVRKGSNLEHERQETDGHDHEASKRHDLDSKRSGNTAETVGAPSEKKGAVKKAP